jgi:hypothetical protein
VLVVRTDLGMGKGGFKNLPCLFFIPSDNPFFFPSLPALLSILVLPC